MSSGASQVHKLGQDQLSNEWNYCIPNVLCDLFIGYFSFYGSILLEIAVLFASLLTLLIRLSALLLSLSDRLSVCLSVWLSTSFSDLTVLRIHSLSDRQPVCLSGCLQIFLNWLLSFPSVCLCIHSHLSVWLSVSSSDLTVVLTCTTYPNVAVRRPRWLDGWALLLFLGPNDSTNPTSSSWVAVLVRRCVYLID